MRVPDHFDAPVGGRFLIEQQVGAGASAQVFRAFDLALERPVALKLLTRWEASDSEHPASHEASLLGSFDHPGIVKIWEAGFLDDLGLPFLAMEWLEGGTLRSRHATTPFSVRQITALALLTARALVELHSRGVVHRDLKPENILLRASQDREPLVRELGYEPVLVDFGIATNRSSGELSGTPAYMSPEQARGEREIDGRSDLYSLGATVFDLLVGRPPHQGQSAIATLARLATTPAPRVSLFRPDLPRPLDDLLDGLLRTDARERPSDAGRVAEELLSCLEEELPPSFAEQESSSRLGTGSSRLVTTIVALGLESASGRDEALELLRSQGADAVPLGSEALVAHLGVHVANGREAQAALELGRNLARAGASVGVASGRAQLRAATGGHAAYPVGEVVDRAASLAREASREQVLADATSAELGRGRYEFRVRGDGSAVVGAAVRGALGEPRGGAPFVGREAELAQILSAHERARSHRRSLLFSISGPPGIGKTRLQREAISRISSMAEPPRVIVQRSDPYGSKHALGAAADLLGSLVGLRKGASVAEAQQALREALGPSTLRNGEGEQQLLARLLANQPLPRGGGAAGTRDALWLAMTDLAVQALREDSLLLVVEDLQWADAESVLWLDHLLGRETDHAALLLACVRPEFWVEHPSRFQQRERIRIDLKPVSKQAARAIAEAVLGESQTPERVDDIVARAGGSPLFAEELARLSSQGQQGVHAPTIESVIQVSLDALSPVCRDAVGRLSVLGLATWDTALAALGLADADRVMGELAGLEVLIEQHTSRFAESREFLFKHALIRDVAYAALAAPHKRELHHLAGQWFLACGGDAATIAGHLDAGDHPELAARFWRQAAERALTTHALRDALTMAERALAFAEPGEDAFASARILDEAWARLDPRAADRQTAVSEMEQNAYDEASRVAADGSSARYDDARGIGRDIDARLAETLRAAAALGLGDELVRCSATLASRAAFAGEFATAEAEVARLLDLSSHEHPSARVDAYQTLAVIRQAKGAVSAALDARKSAVGAAREAGLKERESTLTTNLGFALSTVGARAEARDALLQGLLLAESVGSAGAARHAQMNLLGWTGLYGTDRQLDGYLAETRAEADAVASGLWAAPDRSNLGVLFYRGLELLAGAPAVLPRALALLRMAAANYRELGHRDVLPGALGAWAEAERLVGDPERAASIAREAAELLFQGAPSLLNEAPLFLTLHKAELALGREDAAREALQRAMPPLLRRLQGLVGSPYARGFLTDLAYNAELVATSDHAGVLPSQVHAVLAGAGS